MKKILFALIISVIVGSTTTIYAIASTTVNSIVTVQDTQDEPMMESSDEAPAGFTQELKKRFIEGGPGFMGIVLICLILGLAISIERIIYLNLSTTNSNKLTDDVEDALKSGGVEAAKEVCRNTKGPVASIFYQGLDRAKDGVESAEKAADSKSWSVYGPKFVELNNIADGGSLETVIADIDTLGYSDDTTLFQMVKDRVRPELEALDIPAGKIGTLLNRIKMIGEMICYQLLTNLQ